jgi:hypothetical protein
MEKLQSAANLVDSMIGDYLQFIFIGVQLVFLFGGIYYVYTRNVRHISHYSFPPGVGSEANMFGVSRLVNQTLCM